MAWFPDYWGEFGIAGRLNVETIELRDFSVNWSDDALITHQYVEGGTTQAQYGPIPVGSRSAISAYTTKGVATVDLPRFLASVVTVGHDEYPWMKDPTSLLQRFGARINRAEVPTIVGSEQEFWYAVQKFILSWAAQFNAQVPMTFMPELWPGMLLALPDYGVQFYVDTVSHSFNFANGAGFTTEAQVMAPSSTDGTGFFLFPKGGQGPVRSTGGIRSTPGIDQ